MIRLKDGTWERLGRTLSAAFPWEAGITVDTSGNPVVSWYEGIGDATSLHIAAYNGYDWFEPDQVPLRAQPGGRPQSPSLAVDPAGRIIVAWIEAFGTPTQYRLNAAQFEGGNWTLLEGLAPAASQYSPPSLTIDPSGNPVVAFFSYSSVSSRLIVSTRISGAWRKTVEDVTT